MTEDRLDPKDRAEPTEDYAAPALTDLGSFAELTQLSTGTFNDSEGMS